VHFSLAFWASAEAITVVGAFLNDQLNIILFRYLLADFLQDFASLFASFHVCIFWFNAAKIRFILKKAV
jgi:hypothetical protein